MRLKLAVNALIKYLCGIILVGLLLFLPVGSFCFWNAWLLLGLLFIPMFFLGLVLLFKAPDLLKRRLDSKEKQGTQKGVVRFSALLFVLGFMIAGLDFRFGWSDLPLYIVIAASVLLVISYALYAEVMRENAYLSRTVKVVEGQTVVDSGLYGLIRHPMYFVTLLLFLSFALVLGSLWSLLCFSGFFPLFVVRILNEEKVLRRELDGYTDYCEKVKYRLIPFVW